MAVSIRPQTEALLREQASRLGQQADTLADMLLLNALPSVDEEYEVTYQAIVEGLADVEAGRTVPFDVARTQWAEQKAARARHEEA